MVAHVGNTSTGDAEQENLQSEFRVTINYIAGPCLTIEWREGHREIKLDLTYKHPSWLAFIVLEGTIYVGKLLLSVSAMNPETYSDLQHQPNCKIHCAILTQMLLD